MSRWLFIVATLVVSVLAPPALADAVFWRVSGVPEGDVLNMRKYPSPGAPQVGALANGDKVQNLGCQRQGSSRWCKVKLLDEMGGLGWVNARYLSQSAGPSKPAGAINHGAGIKNRCAKAVARKAGVSPADVVVTRTTISEGTGHQMVYVGVPYSKADWVCEATRNGNIVNVFYGG